MRKKSKEHTHEWLFEDRISGYAEFFYETDKDVTHKKCYCRICGETWVKKWLERNHWPPIRGVLSPRPYAWVKAKPSNEAFDEVKNPFNYPDHSK